MKRLSFSKVLAALTITLMATSLTACSSSPSETDATLGDDAALSDEIPDLEAGTDSVPPGGDLEQVENIEGLPAGSLADNGDGLPPAADAAPPAAMEEPPAAEPLAQDAMATSEPVAQEPANIDPSLADVPATNTASDFSAPAETADSSGSTFSGGSSGSDSYTVQRGDTLMKIAFENYGDLYQWRKIYDLNQDVIQDPNNLPPGIALKIEHSSPVQLSRNGERYLIKNGDTLGTISGDVYGTSAKWRKLWENNRQLIKDPNRIFAGFSLYYVITPEEQEESNRLRQMQQDPSPPLATGAQPDDRGPASATATQIVPATPGT